MHIVHTVMSFYNTQALPWHHTCSLVFNYRLAVCSLSLRGQLSLCCPAAFVLALQAESTWLLTLWHACRHMSMHDCAVLLVAVAASSIVRQPPCWDCTMH
jgi:hypothetical protein